MGDTDDISATTSAPGAGQAATDGFVLGVLGASGGVGATALATACAVRAAAAGREVVLLDTHPWGGGIEVMAGLDSAPGLRWIDLLAVRGDVDPWRLVGELPLGQGGFRCLSWGDRAPREAPPGPDPMLNALRAAVPIIVVDLPRPAGDGSHQLWWQECDELVLVVDATVPGLGSALVVAKDLSSCSGLVLREATRGVSSEVSAALAAPVLARLTRDSSVARCLEQGRAVGSEEGSLADAAEEVLGHLLPGLRAA